MATVSDELDDEFDKFLLEMKPFVLQLPHKSDRQRCALWIKKLCEPTGHGITGRKNRNMYAKLLLHMLKKALIEGPFSHKPDPGPLPTLPDYMSIYFDEPTQTKSPRLREEGYHSLPDWVDTELVNSGRTNPRASRTRQRLFDSDIGKLSSPDVTETGSLGMHERKSSPVNHSFSSSSSSDDHQVFSHKDTHIKYQQKDSVSLKYSPKQSTVVDLPDLDSRPDRRSERRDKVEKQTIPDSKPKHRLTPEKTQGSSSETVSGISFGYRGSSKFSEEAVQVEREVELRTKLLETRFHEEKLIIQQRHDEAIQKILDRKNAEIEEMKHQYRSKTKDLEETNKKLERKVHSATRDVASVKETKDKQIRELRKMLEQTNQTSQNHFEKMLQGALADIEQEKFEMQKEHTKGIQDILEDTNIRLQKMEMEYNEQVDKHATVIKELESRIHQLTAESEKQDTFQGHLQQDKDDLERLNAALRSELQNMSEKFATVEKTLDQLKADNDREVRSIKARCEAMIEFTKNEHSTVIKKDADKLRASEQQVQELKKALQESELSRQRQVRETEAELKQDKIHLENLHEKKVRSLEAELDHERQEWKKKQHQLEQIISAKDEEVAKLKEFQKLQTQQAERTLGEFKSQVERNSGKMFDEMKQQMVKVEADLARSKEFREKQAEEFTKQRQQDRRKFEKQLSVLHGSHEQEKASLTKHLQAEQESLKNAHQEEIKVFKEKYERRLLDTEGSLHELRSSDNIRISELQETISQLRQDILESDSLRKQEVVQLGLLKEEEKQKITRDHEIEINRLLSEKEQQRLRLQKEHSATIEETMQNTNHRLKEIENEYKNRLEESSQHVQELQLTVEKLKEKAESTKSNMEMQLTETVSQLEMEKNLLRRQQSEMNKSLKQQADQFKDQCRKLDSKLRRQELDQQEQLTQIKMEYEGKMRGLLPASVRQQLEGTISSLKSQVHSLQQRTSLLQEEVDIRNGMPSNSFTTSSQVLNT